MKIWKVELEVEEREESLCQRVSTDSLAVCQTSFIKKMAAPQPTPTRVSPSYSPLEQYLVLELAGMHERISNLERQKLFQDDYIDELEVRMSHMEEVLKRLLNDNAMVNDATRTVMESVIDEENLTDDLQRLLDEFDEEMENGQEEFERFIFGM